MYLNDCIYFSIEYRLTRCVFCRCIIWDPSLVCLTGYIFCYYTLKVHTCFRLDYINEYIWTVWHRNYCSITDSGTIYGVCIVMLLDVPFHRSSWQTHIWNSFMSNSYFPQWYPAGEFQVLQLIVFVVFGAVDSHPVNWFTFWKCVLNGS